MAVQTDERPVSTPPPTSHGAMRWVGFLPAAAFLATFGLFFVDKNKEARTVLDSGRGLLTVAVIVAGYVVIAYVLRRFVRFTWIPPLALTAVVLVLAAWIVRPYYVDETANRELVTGPVRDHDDRPRAPNSTGQTPRAPAGPVRLAAGPLRGIDHDATGTVSLVEATDGSKVVRFETFDIEGVPDPQLYLVPGTDRREPGGRRLGRLPGNRGQVLDIEVPDGTDAGDGWTLLVWCRAFSVPIANATLTAT
jgi:hypothetical protein